MPKETKADRSTKALQYARLALKAASEVAAISPFPQVQNVFKLALVIIESVEATDDVETVFANLAAQVCRTLKFIADTLRDRDVQTAKKLAKDLKDVSNVIKGIETLVKAQQERGRFDRWFSAHDDDGRAKQLSQQLQRELDFFALKSHVHIRAGIQDLQNLVGDLRDDIASLKIPQTPSVPEASSSKDTKHIRRKSDTGHSKGKDNRNKQWQDKSKLTKDPPSPSAKPNVKRSKSMDDIASAENKKNEEKNRTKDTPNQSTKEQQKKPEAEDSKRETRNKVPADKPSKNPVKVDETNDKVSKSPDGKNQAAGKSKQDRKGDTKATADSNKKESPKPSQNKSDQAKAPDKKKDNSDSKKPDTSQNDTQTAVQKSSEVETSRTMRFALEGFTDDPKKSSKLEPPQPGKERRRANSMGNVNKDKKPDNKSSNETKKVPAEKLKNDEKGDSSDLSRRKSIGGDKISLSPKSRRSPSPAPSDTQDKEKSGDKYAIWKPETKTEPTQKRHASDGKPAKKLEKRDQAEDARNFVYVVSPPPPI